MITSSLNAKRFAGKPLQQPLYRFDSIPKCNRDLKGSTLSEIINRDDFVDATAEMVLLCNEAMRRSNQTSAKKTSKPLSLEYIADRLVSQFTPCCINAQFHFVNFSFNIIYLFVFKLTNFKLFHVLRILMTQ